MGERGEAPMGGKGEAYNTAAVRARRRAAVESISRCGVRVERWGCGRRGLGWARGLGYGVLMVCVCGLR
jgi:hypothetical protein